MRRRATKNQVVLVGFVGAPPISRATPDGRRWARFRLATECAWRDGAGRWQRVTEWHSCVVWDRPEAAGDNDGREGGARSRAAAAAALRKGDYVHVEGRIEPRCYHGEDGPRAIVEINVRDLIALDRCERAGARDATDEQADDADAREARMIRRAGRSSGPRVGAVMEDP